MIAVPLFSFVALIGLYQVYILMTRRALVLTQSALREEIIRSEKALAGSFIDPLTGAFNRRYMDYLVLYESQRVDRSQGVMSLLMIDIDRLKAINDGFGHASGDYILLETANLLKGHFRQSDTVFRYGGDEFLILLPNTPKGGALRVRERLLDAVHSWNIEHPELGFSMSLSTGIESYSRGMKIEDVLQRADEQMYLNKQQQAGRTAHSKDKLAVTATETPSTLAAKIAVVAVSDVMSNR